MIAGKVTLKYLIETPIPNLLYHNFEKLFTL